MASLDGFNEGEKVTVTINGYVNNACAGDTVLTKIINIPYYNYFSESEECGEHPDFKYCEKILPRFVDNKTIFAAYEKYLKGENVDEQDETTAKGFNKEIIIIIVGVILSLIIVMILITYIVKKRRKNKL